ncbi:hypothetical protein GCM10023205_71200 [Yinghuangia aomiensis]|uniref:Uncharacterized protein n=1 Tax=Yinghuangia aomiensis TaxID=676205 RepID=A0ABP9I7G0_9ACTN
MNNQLTATAAPLLAPLLSATVNAPLWVTVPLHLLGASTVVVHQVLQVRTAREHERATRHAEARRDALEDETVHAARTITDRAERTRRPPQPHRPAHHTARPAVRGGVHPPADAVTAGPRPCGYGNSEHVARREPGADRLPPAAAAHRSVRHRDGQQGARSGAGGFAGGAFE